MHFSTAPTISTVKAQSLLLFLLASLAATSVTRATIVYSGQQDVPIPLDPEGEYLRIDTGATSGAFPADWATAPWINPFFGGVDIGNSPLLRPVITGTDQILNLPVGTLISSGSNFVAGESGSSTHFGIGTGQFALNAPGYLGVTFRSTVGGPDYYGWVQMQISNIGLGRINSWAYENVSGTPILAGYADYLPEPGVLALLGSCLLCLGRRLRPNVRRGGIS